jgi:uncharacterized membrane protein YkoI
MEKVLSFRMWLAGVVLAAGVLLAAFAPAPAFADDDDHELARRLLTEGRILSLAKVVESVMAEVPGEMLEVEFEVEDGAYVYEIKILRPDGRVQEVEADAATGKILKIEDDD